MAARANRFAYYNIPHHESGYPYPDMDEIKNYRTKERLEQGQQQGQRQGQKAGSGGQASASGSGQRQGQQRGQASASGSGANVNPNLDRKHTIAQKEDPHAMLSQNGRKCFDQLYITQNIDTKHFLKPNTGLTDKQEKFCRCLLHVGCQQSDDCLQGRNLRPKRVRLRDGRTINSFEDSKGNNCYNVYPVCTKRTKAGLGGTSCLLYYNFTNTSTIPTSELYALVLREQKRLNALTMSRFGMPFEMFQPNDPDLRGELLNILRGLQDEMTTGSAAAAAPVRRYNFNN